MRRVFTYGIIFAFCNAAIDPAESAYVIKLVNGNEYVTTRYWREGTQVLFDAYGGVFGVDRAVVSKIERSSRSVPLPIERAQEKPVKTEQQSLGSLTEGNRLSHEKLLQPTGTIPDAAEPKKPLKKDEDILKEYGELQKRFGQLNDLPKHEVHALDADIDSFRNKVLNSELAEAHKEEMDALTTLQRAIKGYVKANQ
jgi:hypothetical protein